MEFDYLFVIGSDDIIDESLMVKYHDVMEDGYEYFGIEDLYFYDLYKKDLFYWGGYDKTSGRVGETIGLGRCISINIIKANITITPIKIFKILLLINSLLKSILYIY